MNVFVRLETVYYEQPKFEEKMSHGDRKHKVLFLPLVHLELHRSVQP